MATLVGLTIYPLKSARGIHHDAADVGPAGLCGDRTWMIVDADGAFVTQRRDGILATITATPTPDGLVLSRDGVRSLTVPAPRGGTVLTATVWNDAVRALDAGDEAAAWVSAAVGRPCRLLHADADTGRTADATWAGVGHVVAFADGFPLLLASLTSLQAVRRDTEATWGIDRFRANLVIDGAPAFAEDDAGSVRIGACRFDIVKPCSRCVMTGRDQHTGAADPAREAPLAALARRRRHDGQVYFGQNLVWRDGSHLRVGDPVEFG